MPEARVVPVQQRPPYARERAVAEKRAALVAAGKSAAAVAAFDAVTEELRVQERKMLAGMSRWASLVMESWRREHEEALAGLPSAWVERLVVEAVVAYLYGYGLVEPVEPAGESGLHPVEFGEAVPVHLHPDVGAAVASFQAIRSRLATT